MQLQHRSQYRMVQISWACCWGYSLVLQPDYIWQATQDCIAPLSTIIQHHISSWEKNVTATKLSACSWTRNGHIKTHKAETVGCKTERLYWGQSFHICLSHVPSSEVFYLSERSVLTVSTQHGPILWFIDVYKEIFVFWHCVGLSFLLINSVYTECLYTQFVFYGERFSTIQELNYFGFILKEYFTPEWFFTFYFSPSGHPRWVSFSLKHL